MSKPVDLVVANIMHEGAAFKAFNPQALRQAIEMSGHKATKENIANVKYTLAEMIARKLLCEISHQCSLKIVMSALKSVKAPCSIADILDGLQAVEDNNK